MAPISASLARRHRLVAINLGLIQPITLTRLERDSLDVYNWCRQQFVSRPGNASMNRGHVVIAWRVAHERLAYRRASRSLQRAA